TTPQNDADYMCRNSSDRPIANLLVARDGAVWVLAAGATNTNGKARSRPFSLGTVPADSMNTHAVGIEIANNGVGEVYPAVQIDAAFGASVAVARQVGLAARDVETHQDYAPDRKIDPATAEAVLGVWRPWAATSSGTWSVDDLRDEHERRWVGPTGDAMPGAVALKQWMRGVLNEAPAPGQLDWPGTVRTQLSTAQDTYNQVMVVQEQLEAWEVQE